MIESYHNDNAIAIDEDGKTIMSTGNPDLATYIRSSLKPFQASAVIAEGATEAAGFSNKEVALMCASHNGETVHIETAKNMIKKLGFNESHYECGSHAPHDKDAREKIRKSMQKLSAFHNNCSGKHSGMLALAKKLNVETKGYTKIEHPVQKTIFKQLKRIMGQRNVSYGIDGCSAPTPFLSLKTIAALFQSLGSEKYPELTKAYECMVEYPYLIGGKNRFDTDFNKTLNGRAVSKAGGEAIRGIVIKTNKYGLMGIAIKIVDGNQRAIGVATMATLTHLNLLNQSEKSHLIQHISKPIYNHRNIHIGDIEAEIINP